MDTASTPRSARPVTAPRGTASAAWTCAVDGSGAAPPVVKDKVLVGTGGGEYGIRGFIAAYDARTGREAWRFYTIPGPGEPGHETWEPCPPNPPTYCDPEAWKHGGGSVWLTGSYDPDLNLTYWGIGNAGPDWNADQRPGDNLYTASVVALDADTGELKWHFQFTPHDRYDYDSVQIPVLIDVPGGDGAMVKLMLYATIFQGVPVEYREGLNFGGGANRAVVPVPGAPAVPTLRRGPINTWTDAAASGAVMAIDPRTGEQKWKFAMTDVTDSGILTTASDLLFTGGREGYFQALDARTGELLWKTNLGGQIVSGPISYEVDGRQYVATIAGQCLVAFALRD